MARETSQATIDRIELCSGWCNDKLDISDARFDDWIFDQYWLETHIAECLADCAIAIEETNLGIRYLMNKDPSYDYNYIVPYWMYHYGGGYITMDLILPAMLSADPDQVTYFVGLVDAYRQSIWNKPFNVDFFAALARGFEEWL